MWECIYHIVIVPKYRKKVLFGEVRIMVGRLLRELADQRGIEIIEGNVCPDHVHLILSIPPKFSVANTLGFLKGKSAIRIHNTFSRKRSLLQKSFWSRGYFVRTVGIDRETAERYVRDQWKKDQFIDGPELDLAWN
jgi:putative transposase